MEKPCEVLYVESMPLGLKVSWATAKVQSFGSQFSLNVHGENIDLTQSFAVLGNVGHANDGSFLEITQRCYEHA